MKTKVLLTVCSLLLFSANAFSGTKFDLEIEVLESAMHGSLGDIHRSNDVTQRMSLVDRGSNMLVLGCDSSSVCKMCVTSDPQAMTQLRAAKSDAYVSVGFFEGTCGNILIMNASTFSSK